MIFRITQNWLTFKKFAQIIRIEIIYTYVAKNVTGKRVPKNIGNKCKFE
jgi:hypothetical protein